MNPKQDIIMKLVTKGKPLTTKQKALALEASLSLLRPHLKEAPLPTLGIFRPAFLGRFPRQANLQQFKPARSCRGVKNGLRARMIYDGRFPLREVVADKPTFTIWGITQEGHWVYIKFISLQVGTSREKWYEPDEIVVEETTPEKLLEHFEFAHMWNILGDAFKDFLESKKRQVEEGEALFRTYYSNTKALSVIETGLRF